MNRKAQPEVVVDYACQLGENPLWHRDEQRLYWTDILTGRMFWYEPATGHSQQIYEGPSVGGFTIQTDGALLLFGQNGSVRRWRQGETEETIISGIPEEEGRRFNDVIADPRGRVFCGTIGDGVQPDCRLYRFDLDGSYHVVQDKIIISNGMGFSPDLKQLYFIDTGIDTIWRYAYDLDTGALTHRHVFADLSQTSLKPDGMTVDKAGNVWFATANGSHVICYSDEARELTRIKFSVRFISSVAFGGKDYSQLYITTGNGHDKTRWGPTAGALFRLDLGVRGLPEYRSSIGL